MQVATAVSDYGFAVLQLSPETQRWYDTKLKVFVEWCEQNSLQLEEVRAVHIRQFIASITSRTNPHKGTPVTSHTVRGYAQVIKGFMNWCAVEYEEVSPNTTRHIAMPKVDQKIIEVFTPDQVRVLFKACEQEYNDDLTKRDQAIVSVFLDTGIRLEELVSLTLEHVHLSPREGYIRVFGKGSKWRDVPLGKQARDTLHKYMTRYRHPSYKEETALFLKRDGTPVKARGIEEMISKLGEWAGIEGVRCSPHTFRHTFAVRYLQYGGDLFKLSKTLGHTKTTTTEIYLRAVKSEDIRAGGISILDRMQH